LELLDNSEAGLGLRPDAEIQGGPPNDLFPLVAEHIEKTAIDVHIAAIANGADDSGGGAFMKGYGEPPFGLPESVHGELSLGDILSGAFVKEDPALSVANGSSVGRNPDLLPISTPQLRFEILHHPDLFIEELDDVTIVGIDIKIGLDIVDGRDHFFRTVKAAHSGIGRIDTEVFPFRSGLEHTLYGIFEHAPVFFLTSPESLLRFFEPGDIHRDDQPHRTTINPAYDPITALIPGSGLRVLRLPDAIFPRNALTLRQPSPATLRARPITTLLQTLPTDPADQIAVPCDTISIGVYNLMGCGVDGIDQTVEVLEDRKQPFRLLDNLFPGGIVLALSHGSLPLRGASQVPPQSGSALVATSPSLCRKMASGLMPS